MTHRGDAQGLEERQDRPTLFCKQRAQADFVSFACRHYCRYRRRNSLKSDPTITLKYSISDSQTMNIILLGIQGSGKGTVANHLHAEHGYSIIATGDLLRAETKKPTKLGNQIKELIDQGKFVPDELSFEIVKKNISSARKGFIIDGYPRNLTQAALLDKYLEETNKKIDLVIFLELEEEEVIERLSGRYICSNCNAIYHVKYIASKTPGICDKCGKALIQREDEKPEAIKIRIKTYYEQTEPLRDFYEQKNILRVVDASGEPQDVFKRVEQVISETENQ